MNKNQIRIDEKLGIRPAFIDSAEENIGRMLHDFETGGIFSYFNIIRHFYVNGHANGSKDKQMVTSSQ